MYMYVYEYVRLVTFEGLLPLYDIYSIIFIHIGMQMVNSCWTPRDNWMLGYCCATLLYLLPDIQNIGMALESHIYIYFQLDYHQRYIYITYICTTLKISFNRYISKTWNIICVFTIELQLKYSPFILVSSLGRRGLEDLTIMRQSSHWRYTVC